MNIPAKSMRPRTRFAPSPTGLLHFGSLRAILFPYCFSKSNNGEFTLRIDNTDSERSKDIYIDDIKEQMKWLEVKEDEIYYQSERTHIYEEIFQLLKEHGKVYECFETEEDLKYMRELKLAMKSPPLLTKKDSIKTSGDVSFWRFELHDEDLEYEDIIYGKLHSTKQWSDPVIRKNNGEFTYIFCSVVDDILLNMTHIIRGADHINNTFIQISLGNCISKILKNDIWNIKFAHFPLLSDAQGKKLSKRTGNNSLKEMHYLEPQTLWSVTLAMGTGHIPIISSDYNDYIKTFHLENYSTCNQILHEKLLMTTNKKILGLCYKPANEKLFELIKHNVCTREDFLEKERKFHDFTADENFYNLVEKKEYLKIYEACFGCNYGPRLEDLLNYIKEYK